MRKPKDIELLDRFGCRESRWFIINDKDRVDNPCIALGSVWVLAKDCRKLAAWLLKAAAYLDRQESRKKGKRT